MRRWGRYVAYQLSFPRHAVPRPARPLSTLLTRMDAPLVSATREAAAHSSPAVTPAASTASTASSLRAYAAHAMAPALLTPSPGSRGASPAPLER